MRLRVGDLGWLCPDSDRLVRVARLESLGSCMHAGILDPQFSLACFRRVCSAFLPVVTLRTFSRDVIVWLTSLLAFFLPAGSLGNAEGMDRAIGFIAYGLVYVGSPD